MPEQAPSPQVRRQDEAPEAHGRETEQCPDCSGPIVRDTENGERVCGSCGLVINDVALDRGPDWRAATAAERDNKSRGGAPITPAMHDKGLSTTIGWQDKDAQGRVLSQRKRGQLARLRTWDQRFRTRDSKDRNLKHALGEIDRMASALGLPTSTRETASVIYRRALDDELLPGRSIEGVATAALYAAARIEGIPRTIATVSRVSRVAEVEFTRAYRYLGRELDLKIPPTNPLDFVGRLASDLDCADDTEHEARELVKQAMDRDVHSGKHPVGIAASAIYIASQRTSEVITQSEISDAGEVSEVTIRNRYQDILAAIDTDNDEP